MIAPATIPITTAPHGSTVAVPAVMPTRPPSTPLSVSERSDLPVRSLEMSIADAAPAPAASVVVTATRAARSAKPPLSARVEPALKPYQPIQRIITPRKPSGIE